METKAGFVTIIGKPNVGKSTLLNALLGEKLSIITNKPQTTRKKIMGIVSTDTYQIIFLDTPGILKPEYLLQETMLDSVLQSARDADVIILMIDISNDPDGNKTFDDENVQKIFAKVKAKKILLINKIDLSDEQKAKLLIAKFEEKGIFDNIFPISALLNFNIDSVLNTVVEYLPVHPKFYPDDQLTDEPERFYVSEIIREKILEMYQEEIPYSTEVVIEDFKERENAKDYISASIIVEKESQKPIMIGKNGSAIKELGQISRTAIESFLQRPVYLELRVKVKDKWRSDPKFLRSFGYTHGEE